MGLDILVVGAGDCYNQNHLPANKKLKKDGVASITGVVDVKPESEVILPEGAVYVQRKPSQPLSELVGRLPQSQKPDVVILSHPNSLHVPDAEDLVRSGHKVLMEKPFALDEAQLSRVEKLLETGRLALVEHYLLGKVTMLHVLSGVASPDSFYLTTPGLLTGDVDKLRQYAGRLTDLIGDVKYVESRVLLGKGDDGHVLHRNSDLSIARRGGGMIQDIGIHAMAPVTALTPKIGRLGSVDRLDVAVAREHVQHYLGRNNTPEEIAETYGDVFFHTTNNVPVHLMFGKYVLGGPVKGRNDRFMMIHGTKGAVELDMSICRMSVFEGDSVTPSWSVGFNIDEFPKYYSVMRAAFEQFGGRMDRRLTRAAFEAQTDVLKLVKAASPSYGNASLMPLYPWGLELHETPALFGYGNR